MYTKPVCENCGDYTSPFIGGEWTGNPTVYAGTDKKGFAEKYMFCNVDCLVEWAAEVRGFSLRAK